MQTVISPGPSGWLWRLQLRNSEEDRLFVAFDALQMQNNEFLCRYRVHRIIFSPPTSEILTKVPVKLQDGPHASCITRDG